MADIEVGVRISEDRGTAEIELVADGQPSKPLQLDLDQLTNLIGLLGEIRAHMLEGRPKLKLEGRDVRTVDRPNWYIQVARIDGSLLAFDHPAFGPVGFAIPKPEVAEIVRLLSGHLAMPSSQPERRN